MKLKKIIPWVTQIVFFVLLLFFARWFDDATFVIEDDRLKIVLFLLSYCAQGLTLSYYYTFAIQNKGNYSTWDNGDKQGLWAGMLIFAMILMWVKMIVF